MKIFKKIIPIIVSIIAFIVLIIVFVLPILSPLISRNNRPVELTPTPISSSSANISPPIILTPYPPQTISKVVTQSTNQGDTGPWGIAQQIDEHTWMMKVGEDSVMATSSEILTALNNYRVNHGSQNLIWDQKLADYAQSRANFFVSIKNLDGHKGFNNFLENEDGFNKLGFTMLGENASFGYQLNGVHLIEWIYAGDEPHDKNQLDNRWNYVGIGVKGTATCLIFGTGKM